MIFLKIFIHFAVTDNPNFEENNLTIAEKQTAVVFATLSKALEENSKGLACELENLMTKYCSDVDRIELTTATTICAPTIQFKALGIDYDEKVTSSFLSSVLSAGDQINVASGYLNFTDNYTKLMAENKALTRVMTASPKANGFYTPMGSVDHCLWRIHCCSEIYGNVQHLARVDENGWEVEPRFIYV